MNASANKPLAIVLAAGKGTRMEVDLPKVLCQVLGRPMIEFALEALHKAGIERILMVVGYQSQQVQAALKEHSGIEFVEQKEQLGTGHAVACCGDLLRNHSGPVLIVAGDSPLMQSSSISQLLEEFHKRKPACLLATLCKEDPTGLGRIVRDSQGNFSAIVEEKEATPQQRNISEVNMSTYLFDCDALLQALKKMSNQNTQGEYYLTDCPAILKKEGKTVDALAILQPCEANSINNMDELKVVEGVMKDMGY